MIHRFDSFELDTDRFELRRDGRAVAVEPQVFALIALLVENHHRMVPREELVERIWTDRVVSDSAVSSRVKSARQALDDDGTTQKYIRTVHGQGFRFVGRVSSPAEAGSASAEPDSAQGWSSEVLARPVIAVLPFENEGGAPEDSYFVDGVAEELIAELSSWRWFPILSRNSTFDRARTGPASARARAMGARYALTGRLQRAGDEARLAVELIDTATDTQLWSAHFARGAADLPGMQAEIAAGVFRKIAPELTSAETRRVMRKRSGDLTAWDLTLKGLWHLHRATPHDFSQSLLLLEEATHADPGFALPWSLIALARFELALKGWTGAGGGGEIRDIFRDMLAAASTSIELDPSGWMGHALMSAGELWTNFSFPRARFHASRAIELNPSGSMAYHFSGCIYGFAGDLDRAIETQSNVYRVDPGYGHADVVEADLGLWCLLSGDLDGATAHLDRALALNPRNVRARQRRIALAGRVGDAKLARAAIAELRALGGATDEHYLRASYPFQDAKHAATFRESLVRAGLLKK
jgi:TolB-like protein